MRYVLILPVVALFACGPEKGGSSGESGSDTSAGSEATNTGTPTTSATGTASEPTTGVTSEPTSGPMSEATTGTLACEDFRGEPDFESRLALTVQYAGEGPVWIAAEGSCGGVPLITLIDEEKQPLLNFASDCSPVICQDFLAQEDCTPQCDNCQAPFLWRLEPGAELTILRPQLRFTPLQMTAECAPGTDCQRECVRPDPLAPGTYEVEVTAFRTCIGDCECFEPGETGGCQVFGAPQTGEPIVATTSLQFPESDKALVIIETP